MLCEYCNVNQPVIKRPANGMQACKPCFIELLELDVHRTIEKMFVRGEKVLVAVSGGKDSTVLAHVMNKLNKKYDYGIDLHLVCVDEGIKGYRDHSLDTVVENRQCLDLDLEIVSFKELFNVTMDEVMQKRKLGSCTYCGVFRRQALEEGARRIGATKIVTGHNADDMAETVLLNLIRGDYNRLRRCTRNCVDKNGQSLSRIKPFKYMYEKEIVFYAYLNGLKYFSTECIYSSGAHREYARMFLRSIDPPLILNTIRSGEFLERSDTESATAKCVSCGGITSSALKRCKTCILVESLNQ